MCTPAPERIAAKERVDGDLPGRPAGANAADTLAGRVGLDRGPSAEALAAQNGVGLIIGSVLGSFGSDPVAQPIKTTVRPVR